MGYCYPTGEKRKDEKWYFLFCDGRSNKCAQDDGPIPSSYVDSSGKVKNPQAKDCVEWCPTLKKAYEAMVILDETQKEYE